MLVQKYQLEQFRATPPRVPNSCLSLRERSSTVHKTWVNACVQRPMQVMYITAKRSLIYEAEFSIQWVQLHAGAILGSRNVELLSSKWKECFLNTLHITMRKCSAVTKIITTASLLPTFKIMQRKWLSVETYRYIWGICSAISIMRLPHSVETRASPMMYVADHLWLRLNKQQHLISLKLCPTTAVEFLDHEALISLII